jgi:hypothetical protein
MEVAGDVVGVRVACYTDATLVTLAWRARDPVKEAAHLVVSAPRGAHSFTALCDTLCVMGVQALKHDVELTSAHGDVSLVGTALDSSDDGMRILTYPDRWHTVVLRDYVISGPTGLYTVRVALEPHKIAVAEAKREAPLVRVQFQVPPLEWSFFHALDVRRRELTTQLRLTGSLALLDAALSAGRAAPLPATFAFLNRPYAARANSFEKRAMARAPSPRADEGEAMMPREAASSASYVAPLVAPDAHGAWVIEKVVIEHAAVERLMRGASTDVAVTVQNDYDPARTGDDGRVYTFVHLDQAHAALALIEPGPLVLVGIGGPHGGGDGDVVEGATLAPDTRLLNAGPLAGVRVTLTRARENPEDRYHEERVVVANARAAEVVMRLVQRNATRVEVLDKADGAVQRTITADRDTESHGSAVRFHIPLTAPRGETQLVYRWYY